MSSIAAAGLYRGTFTEDMFEEAEDLDHPYYRTKHDSEGLVRANGRIPFRIYRPGVVVGHSKTGFIDKIDGPYYFFKALQKMRESWPRWIPLVGLEGGYVNLVPVDYVVNAHGPPRAPAEARRPLLPPHRPQAAAGRRDAERVRARRARARDGVPPRFEDLRDGAGGRHAVARAQQAGAATS